MFTTFTLADFYSTRLEFTDVNKQEVKRNKTCPILSKSDLCKLFTKQKYSVDQIYSKTVILVYSDQSQSNREPVKTLNC